jgi:S1-C subfamily serine protease
MCCYRISMSDFRSSTYWIERILFLFIVGLSWAESASADLVRIVAQAKPAVVLLEVVTRDGLKSGTGFFISSDGFLVTNAHVVSGAHGKNDVVAL